MPDTLGYETWELGSFGTTHFAATQDGVQGFFFTSKEAREYIDLRINAARADGLKHRWHPFHDVYGRSMDWLKKQSTEVREQYRRAFNRQPVFGNGMGLVDPDYIDYLAEEYEKEQATAIELSAA